jgi:hypothetical protein
VYVIEIEEREHHDARRLAWRLTLQAITGTAPDGADVGILGASAIDLRFLWKAQLDPWQVLIGARWRSGRLIFLRSILFIYLYNLYEDNVAYLQ